MIVYVSILYVKYEFEVKTGNWINGRQLSTLSVLVCKSGSVRDFLVYTHSEWCIVCVCVCNQKKSIHTYCLLIYVARDVC